MALKTAADDLLAAHPDGLVFLAGAADGKPAVVCKLGKRWVDAGLKAGQLVSEAAKILGGKGGGRPDFAQGGGGDPAQLAAALNGVLKSLSQVAGSSS